MPIQKKGLSRGSNVHLPRVPGGSGSYKEGKEITILYDPADPSKVALPYSALANVLMYVGGGLAVIIGLAGLVISGRRG